MIKHKADLAVGIKDCAERSIDLDLGNIFPLRPGNDIVLLSTGEQAYTALLKLINEAEKNIEVATFILGDDETGAAILEVLTRQAAAGLRVRLLLDALGSFRISEKKLAAFLANGGEYAFFMPMRHLPFRGRANLRNHRKIVIVDNQTAIVGGMNIAHEYMGKTNDSHRWQDLSLIVKGPVLADLIQVFRSDWQFAAQQSLPESDLPVLVETGDRTPVQLMPSGPDIVGDPLYESIITAFFKARRRVWIVTPYFIPDEMMLKALGITARRGIDVRIVVPRVSNHRLADLVRRSYLRQLQESGAKVYNYTPGMVHAKVILIDDELSILGSMNMDSRSFFLNYEIVLFLYNENLVRELEVWILDLISHSFTGVKNVNLFISFWEEVARLMAPLL